MKVAIDVRCLGEGRRTGVEEYVVQLLRSLFEKDKENEYVLFFNAWNGAFPRDLDWMLVYPNVSLKTFRIPNKILNILLWYFRFPKLDRLCGGVDIFFLPNLNFVAISPDAKLLLTAHDLSFEAFPEAFSWKRRLWHFLIGFKDLCRRADHIIAVSSSTKDDLIGYYGIPERKISVIRSGIGNEFQKLDRNDKELMRVKEKYDLPYRFILFLGTFEPRKNITAVIRAYEGYRRTNNREGESVKLVLAGSPGWSSSEIFRSIKNSPYRSDIIVIGFVLDEEKPALYNLASVFVYPSLYEGFGFPPIEAMACGTPAIVSRNSSFPEVVGDAAIMIDPHQPDELRMAIELVLADRLFTEKLSRDGKEKSREFSWDRTASALLRLIQSKE